jgi:alpha-tubulin suppressor-like RCC1 family protein
VLETGAVACWGDNAFGQLGTGAPPDGGVMQSRSTVPLVVAGVSGASRVACGEFHTCALLRSGAVMCWGWNAAGQLGRGTTDSAAHPEAAPVLF